MHDPLKALQELGITVPQASPALGAYTPAVRAGRMVFTTGQLPMENGKLKIAGVLGEGVTTAEGQKATELCFINILSAILSTGVGLHQIERFVKLTGFLNASADYTEHSLVMNGASNLCQKVFGNQGVHARTTIGVKTLPLGAPVEVEAIVYLKEEA